MKIKFGSMFIYYYIVSKTKDNSLPINQYDSTKNIESIYDFYSPVQTSKDRP